MKTLGSVITGLRVNAESLFYGVAMAAVSFAAGFISYTHISALVMIEGQSWKTAHLMFLPVDGQIVIGTGYYMRNSGRARRWLGLLGFVPGFGESVVANWMSGAPHGLFAAAVATVPAQAFAVSSFLFERWLHEWRAGRKAAAPAVLPHSDLTALLGWPAAQRPVPVPQAAEPPAPGPEPVTVHLHAAPEGAPWGLVSPAAVPVPEPAALSFPVRGPVMTLPARPKAKSRPRVVPDAADERLPLPDDEDKLRALVNSMSRNDLFRTYQVSKGGADKLRQQYLTEEEVA